jgi:hypothetical protein
MLSQTAYYGTGWARVDAASYPTELSTTELIDVYVSLDAADAYRAISPDVTEVNVEFPVGGTIVRVVEDEQRQPQKITMMVKQPAGYFPEGGDFLYAVTDLGGKPMTDGSTLQWGKVNSCTGCHIPRQNADWLFGVPTTNRTHP